MSYLYLTSCNECGKTTKPAKSKAEAMHRASSTGWLFVRHMGHHFCPECRKAKDIEGARQKSSGRPTREQISAEASARRAEREATAQRLRDAGRTWKEVGAALGVSGTRASQIYEAGKRRQQRNEVTAARVEDSASVETKPQDDKSANEIRVDDIPFTVRVANSLRSSGITTASDLAALSESDLLKLPNLSRKSLKEIRTELAKHGLVLREGGH